MLISGEVELLASWTRDGRGYDIHRTRLADASEVIVVNSVGPDESHRLALVPAHLWESDWLSLDETGRTQLAERALAPVAPKPKRPRHVTGRRVAARRAPLANGLPGAGTFGLPVRRALPLN